MRSIVLTLALLGGVPLLYPAQRTVEFNRDIRPILSDKCYSCHGTDAVAKKIPLRLDSEAAAKADLGGRRAIVDGDHAAGLLRIETFRRGDRHSGRMGGTGSEVAEALVLHSPGPSRFAHPEERRM